MSSMLIRIDGRVIGVEARQVDIVDQFSDTVIATRLGPALPLEGLIEVTTLGSVIPEFVSSQWAD